MHFILRSLFTTELNIVVLTQLRGNFATREFFPPFNFSRTLTCGRVTGSLGWVQKWVAMIHLSSALGSSLGGNASLSLESFDVHLPSFLELKKFTLFLWYIFIGTTRL